MSKYYFSLKNEYYIKEYNMNQYLTPEVYEFVCQVWVNKQTYANKLNHIKKMCRMFDKDILTTNTLTFDVVRAQLDTIESLDIRKSMANIMKTIAIVENSYDVSNYMNYCELVKLQYNRDRESKTIEDKVSITWPQLLELCAGHHESDYNLRLMAALLSTMPAILRNSEYASMQIKTTYVNNYYNETRKTFVINDQKSANIGERQIPVSQEVQDILATSPNNTYIFEKRDGTQLSSHSINSLVKKISGETLTAIRALHATECGKTYTDEQKILLSYYMGHCIETHQRDYDKSPN